MGVRQPSRLRRAASKLLFPVIGIGAGVGLCWLATARIEALDPHDPLDVAAPDRLYVTEKCRHSQTALDLLASTPGSRPVLTIPLDLDASPERDRICRPAVSMLRREGSLWWSVLPESYVCTRLIAASKAWLAEERGEPVPVPAWVVGGELIEAGVSDENLALLRAEGVLGETLAQSVEGS